MNFRSQFWLELFYFSLDTPSPHITFFFAIILLVPWLYYLCGFSVSQNFAQNLGVLSSMQLLRNCLPMVFLLYKYEVSPPNSNNLLYNNQLFPFLTLRCSLSLPSLRLSFSLFFSVKCTVTKFST